MPEVRSWGWGLLLGVSILGVWLASPDLSTPARVLTVVLVTVLPALMLVQARLLQRTDPAELPRFSAYLSSSLALWVLAGVTLGVALGSGFTWTTLGLLLPRPLELLGWSLAATAAGLAILVVARWLRLRESLFLEHLLPRTTGEKIAFLGVSLTAGVCEELIFRSFLIPALDVVIGSLAAAVVVSSLVFGVLHGYQGGTGVVRTSVLGLLLAIPFLATGSIVPSMIAHFALDVIAGIWLSDWLVRRETDPRRAQECVRV